MALPSSSSSSSTSSSPSLSLTQFEGGQLQLQLTNTNYINYFKHGFKARIGAARAPKGAKLCHEDFWPSCTNTSANNDINGAHFETFEEKSISSIDQFKDSVAATNEGSNKEKLQEKSARKFPSTDLTKLKITQKNLFYTTKPATSAMFLG
ncbi:hypothetical protein HELRODRAFT_181004 [Helobdella robusta]|uniref:Uncharacterized protein n=1 Tax=Helobdella robusta TaxID=6412 RepID=T1FGI4_HELRO|nr:hypothetical protein HELRODRAFT_181004 [Helobdella robusta]ESN93460.1 hypothetical protein HELRODRAFT_181004 [Helobdella robusta]